MTEISYLGIGFIFTIGFISGALSALLYRNKDFTVPNTLSALIAIVYISWSAAEPLQLTDSQPGLMFSILGASSIAFLSGEKFGQAILIPIITAWKK